MNNYSVILLLGLPLGSVGKESTCNAEDLGWEDTLEKGMATQYSGLENSTDCIVHAKLQRVGHD